MKTFFYLAALWACATLCHPVALNFTATNITGATPADTNINSVGDHSSFPEDSAVSQATAAGSGSALAFPVCVDLPYVCTQTVFMAARAFMSVVMPVAAVLYTMTSGGVQLHPTAQFRVVDNGRGGLGISRLGKYVGIPMG